MNQNQFTKMKLFGLVGYPLSHSFSKKYFDEKFIKENLQDCFFQNFEISNIAHIANIVQQNAALKGFAITIPHKQTILPLLHQTTNAVQQIQACNCVKIINQKLIGFNTDVIGFEKSFTQKLQPHHTQALILGTGGAAHAVIYILQKLNIPYTIVSRKNFAHKNYITYQQLNQNTIQQHTIIINTTPVGTYPNNNNYPNIPYQFITTKHYLFDVVYNPSKTKFLLLGEQQGATIKNGYNMLTIQAEENWKIWNTDLGL